MDLFHEGSYEQRHASKQMPEGLAKDVALRYHERDGTNQLLSCFPRSVKVKCAGASCPCKKEGP